MRELTPPAVDNWQPLVVMANPKSGGKDGELVMNTLKRLLNPVQVSGSVCSFVSHSFTFDLSNNHASNLVMTT